MTTKVLKEQDTDAVLSLYNGRFIDGWNKNMLLSSFKTGRFLCIGSFDGDKLVGVVMLMTAGDAADLESVFVDPLLRRQGIASSLLTAAEKILVSDDIKKIFLEVRQSNIFAINFYVKSGFKNISVRKKYYFDGEDAVVMVKEL